MERLQKETKIYNEGKQNRTHLMDNKVPSQTVGIKFLKIPMVGEFLDKEPSLF